jgi:hypothetical protein
VVLLGFLREEFLFRPGSVLRAATRGHRSGWGWMGGRLLLIGPID